MLEKLWQDVIRQGPPRSDWVARGRWHMIQLLAGPAGKFDQAIKLCAVQIKEFPNHPEGERAMFTRAWLLWTRKDWKNAKLAFEELTAAYPHTTDAPPIQRYIHDCDAGHPTSDVVSAGARLAQLHAPAGFSGRICGDRHHNRAYCPACVHQRADAPGGNAHQLRSNRDTACYRQTCANHG